MMLIPPTSGRKAVRLQHAAFIAELSSLYSLLMSTWIHNGPGRRDSESADGRDGNNTEKASTMNSVSPGFQTKWTKSFREQALQLFEQLEAMQVSTAMAKFEGSIRGAWPADEYQKLIQHEHDMLAAFGQVRLIFSFRGGSGPTHIPL